MTVSALGPQPLTYRWMKDGQDIPGAKTINKLTILSFSSENQGKYSCNVSGGQQLVESNPASLGLGMY